MWRVRVEPETNSAGPGGRGWGEPGGGSEGERSGRILDTF